MLEAEVKLSGHCHSIGLKDLICLFAVVVAYRKLSWLSGTFSTCTLYYIRPVSFLLVGLKPVILPMLAVVKWSTFDSVQLQLVCDIFGPSSCRLSYVRPLALDYSQ